MRYEVTAADRRGLPSHYADEARYLGYREADLARPYASFFDATTRPMLPHVVEALAGGRAAPELAYPVDDVVGRLSRPGHEPLETGWAVRDGRIFVAVHTPMPGVTAAMWDWWFGWHLPESARYKLWHPGAHQFAAVAEDRSADRDRTDRERYVGNASYVDEYIGGRLQRLAIRFVDAQRAGFEDTAGSTHVCARVSLAAVPLAIGWLVHQVRPTPDGVEMRSRFFLNELDALALPPAATPGPGRLLATRAGRVAVRAVPPVLSLTGMPRTLGPDMVAHCAAEMNHLAHVLPELHAAFAGTP